MRFNKGGGKARRHYRTTTVNMNELMHIVLSLQLMFGSRRAGVAIIVILLFCGVGYFAFNRLTDPSYDLRQADELWNLDQNADAIRMYKSILSGRDPLDPNYFSLPGPERPRLYRRIISHEALLGNRADARDWITRAYGEGINFEKADFENDQVHQLWLEVTADYQDPEQATKKRDLLQDFLDRK